MARPRITAAPLARTAKPPAPIVNLNRPSSAGVRSSPPPNVLTFSAATHFMESVARREANAQRPGVMFDGETGLTFDGHAIDAKTGELVGGPRNWSAPSKESLDVTLLVKAVQGDRVAQLAISPTGRPEDARAVALDRLSRKIESYRDFDRRYPGFGGFLPWFKVDGRPGQRRMQPMPDWRNRVPALDNGQLAWSLYHAASALKDTGHEALARKYQAQFDRMSNNVVRVFFDPTEKALRAEARLDSSRAQPEVNRYETNPDNRYFLNDAAEGMMMVHFADLFGKWSHAPSGARDALWSVPRHHAATFVTAHGERITVDRGWRFSSHEDWAFVALPLRDVPVVDKLFMNAQRVRTSFSADGERPGLFASTHRPVAGNENPAYDNRVGIRAVGTKGTRAIPTYAPYAAFPLALADKTVFATWYRNMLSAPRMFGPNGAGESFNGAGTKIAPVLTWDGKVLPLVAWSGGIAPEIAARLKADGKYDRFIETVTNSYRTIGSGPIEGTSVPLRAPTAAPKQATPDFGEARSP